MSRKDIIMMAREAGWQYADGDDGYNPLWRFAALVAAAERENIAAWVEDMCAGLDAKTIANGIRNGGNDDMRAFQQGVPDHVRDTTEMIERGTKAWADVPDATAWVDEMRGNIPAPTGQESRQVEPVAYVNGYFDGKCVIKPIESVVLPAGMALYRSPPTINEMETVEPVAYSYPDARGRTVLVSTNTAPYEDAKPLYTAPPKREPLSEEQIEFRFGKKPTRYMLFLIRSTERAHGIGVDE